MVKDLMEKKQHRHLLDQICLKALFALSRMQERPDQEILDFALEAGIMATDSEIGFIHFVSKDETGIDCHTWSKKVVPQCSGEDSQGQFRIAETGLWADAFRQKKPVILNDFNDYPLEKFYPKNQIPARQHMSLPVFDTGKMVMLAGVGNKSSGYLEEDVQSLSLIMEGTWNIIKRRRVENEITRINENLEKIVKDRTGELLALNEELNKTIKKQQDIEDAFIISDFELEKSKEQLQIIMDNMPVLMSYVDDTLHFKFVNAHYSNLFRLNHEDLVGEHVSKIVGKEFFKNVETKYKAALKGEKQRFEMPISPAGEDYIFDISYIPHLHGNTIEGIFVLAVDITQRKQMEKELQQLSITDPLTGATNRRFFMDTVSNEIERCKRYDIPLSFMMIDIDYFKIINDSYGHKTGDEVLIALVNKALAILRSTDIFSRIGGEEFASILIETELEKAATIAERLRKALEQVRVESENKKIQFTVSIGLTQLKKQDDELEDMMKRADTALYMAKNQGRNKVMMLH